MPLSKERNLKMKTLFPEISPFKTHHLEVDSTHNVYVEESGNPEGKPVIFLHGGPGGGTGPKQRQFFDPSHYRIILFDQRGCGKSVPNGEIINNTTKHLIDDIETIRKHLLINEWLLFGGSWGSTLALAYACEYPHLVKGMILRGIFLSRPFELSWFLREVKIFFPEKYDSLISFHHSINEQSLVTDYSRLVFGKDLKLAKKASFSWNKFEGSILKLTYDNDKTQQKIDYDEELARAKVQLHYIKHNCFIDGDEIINNLQNIEKKIPVEIVQGQYDMVCPPKTTFDLYNTIPNANLHLIPDAGHSASEPGITNALINATNEFKYL